MNIVASHEFRIPYMVGVYLAVNALPDVYLLTDGPDCLFFKAEYVHGAQDFHSTLLDVRGRHRVAHTLADINSVVLDREHDIAALARRLVLESGAGMVLITAMPMASITGTQYDRIARTLMEETGRPVAEVPARSLQGDWLDGYAQVLAAVAQGIPLPADVTTDPETVAVVGPLMDRTEADRLADDRELRRMLEDGLGLRVSAILPSNCTIAELADLGRAGTVISLPYGTRAAKILARRTGATLVQAPLPFGPAGVEGFVNAVASSVGRTAQGKAFLKAERERWFEPFGLVAAGIAGRRFAVIADPWLADATVGLLEAAGATVLAAQSTAQDPKPVRGLPTASDVESPGSIDMFLVPTRGIDFALRHARPFFEYGFTSFGTHAFFDAPVLGWGGAVNLLNSVAAAMSLFGGLGGSEDFDLRRVAASIPGAVGGSEVRDSRG